MSGANYGGIGSNYGGRQPNSTAYIKTFIEGTTPPNNPWKSSIYVYDKKKVNVLTPSKEVNIYIPNNIYIGGSIIYTTPSDVTESVVDSSTPIISSSSSNINTRQEQINNLQKKLDDLQKQINNLKIN